MFPGTKFHRSRTECSSVVAVRYIPEYATSRGRSEIKEDKLMVLHKYYVTVARYQFVIAIVVMLLLKTSSAVKLLSVL